MPSQVFSFLLVLFFLAPGLAWTELAMLRPTDVGPQEQLGQQTSVAVNDDGTVVAMGIQGDNSGIGAAWIFVPTTDNKWIQQGSKLIGSGVVYPDSAAQGVAVALNSDGTTLGIGGPNDDQSQGAFWVFVFDGKEWLQQGPKLVVNTTTKETMRFGSRIAFSGLGDIAAVSGYYDRQGQGATWVWLRTGSGTSAKWSQQGGKLFGTGSSGIYGAYQGKGLAISYDGSIIAVGGPQDGNDKGAVWIFERNNNGLWSQQGSKLVGTDGTPLMSFGITVALSTNGQILLVSAINDDFGKGSAFSFTFNGSTYVQQSKKFGQGAYITASGDGNLVALGDPYASNNAGCTYPYSRQNNQTDTPWNSEGTLIGSGNNAEFRGEGVALSRNGQILVVGGFLGHDYGNSSIWIWKA